jgi:hypothetical protein
MNINPDTVKLIKNGRSLLRVSLKEVAKSYNSHKGEVDIFIHAAKKMHFDLACLQTIKGRFFCESTVNNISWHGYYDNSKNDEKLPVINFKNNVKKVWCPRHKGVIQQEDIFLFPICSVYFPPNMNTSALSVIKENTNTYKVKMDNRSNIRADFFVLPQGISLKQFMENFDISFFILYDITLFNKSLNGPIEPLPVLSEKDIIFQSFEIDKWTLFIRLIYTDKTREPELCGKYSILFHDPNDAMETLLNRRKFIKNNTNGYTIKTFREIYYDDLRKFKSITSS